MTLSPRKPNCRSLTRQVSVAPPSSWRLSTWAPVAQRGQGLLGVEADRDGLRAVPVDDGGEAALVAEPAGVAGAQAGAGARPEERGFPWTSLTPSEQWVDEVECAAQQLTPTPPRKSAETD